MSKESAKKVVVQEKTSTIKVSIAAVEKTVKNWPQWKRDTYNTYFATANGAKKY